MAGLYGDRLQLLCVIFSEGIGMSSFSALAHLVLMLWCCCRSLSRPSCSAVNTMWSTGSPVVSASMSKPMQGGHMLSTAGNIGHAFRAGYCQNIVLA